MVVAVMVVLVRVLITSCSGARVGTVYIVIMMVPEVVLMVVVMMVDMNAAHPTACIACVGFQNNNFHPM